MIIAAIFVADLDNAIGKNNQLLCHLPADLKFFKQTTMGSPVIMGRKTYESMGRLLPGRRNIIITRSREYKVEGAEVHHGLEAAIKACESSPDKTEKLFIIGGAEIFKQALPYTREIYRTVIDHRFEADTYLEPLPEQEFSKVWEECHSADEKNPFDYCFQKWLRK